MVHVNLQGEWTVAPADDGGKMLQVYHPGSDTGWSIHFPPDQAERLAYLVGLPVEELVAVIDAQQAQAEEHALPKVPPPPT